MKSITALVSVLLLVAHVSQAAIVVALYSGSDNLPQTVAGATLINTPNLNPGWARIHTDSGGASPLSFGKYLNESGDSYLYWFRATDVPTGYSGTGAGVYWLGNGNNTLVSGAEWGADNFTVLHDGHNTVAVLQFSFEEVSKRPTLIASAHDAGGLTFANGVAAIQLATVPEPSTTALLIGGSVIVFALSRRRKK